MDEYVEKQHKNIIGILVDALNFYSDGSNYIESEGNKKPMILIDNGDYARMVLEIKSDIEKEINLATLDFDNFMQNIVESSDFSDLDDVKIQSDIMNIKKILKKYDDNKDID